MPKRQRPTIVATAPPTNAAITEYESGGRGSTPRIKLTAAASDPNSRLIKVTLSTLDENGAATKSIDATIIGGDYVQRALTWRGQCKGPDAPPEDAEGTHIAIVEAVLLPYESELAFKEAVASKMQSLEFQTLTDDDFVNCTIKLPANEGFEEAHAIIKKGPFFGYTCDETMKQTLKTSVEFRRNSHHAYTYRTHTEPLELWSDGQPRWKLPAPHLCHKIDVAQGFTPANNTAPFESTLINKTARRPYGNRCAHHYKVKQMVAHLQSAPSEADKEGLRATRDALGLQADVSPGPGRFMKCTNQHNTPFLEAVKCCCHIQPTVGRVLATKFHITTRRCYKRVDHRTNGHVDSRKREAPRQREEDGDGARHGEFDSAGETNKWRKVTHTTV